MTTVGERLKAAVSDAMPELLSISEEESDEPREPGKWSPKEILGHLVDSASNNHQRFVRAQFQDDLVFPGYDQEAWVAAQRYATASWLELVDLWRGFNLLLAHVMEAAPEDDRTRPHAKHSLDAIAFRPVPASEPATLQYLMEDYVVHLEHHLRQILGD